MFVGYWDKERDVTAFPDCVHSQNIVHDESAQTFSRLQTTVLFFGRLYNREALGFAADANDAEIIYRLFDEHHIRDFNQLDGAFTCIIRFANVTIIFRDHHGLGPQVYYSNSCFASSPALLSEFEGRRFEPDYSRLSRFLSIGYIDTPHTAFQGMKKLGAGEAMSEKTGYFDYHSLFPTSQLKPVFEEMSADDYAEEYGRLHRESLRKRMVGGERFGLLLSGGYDSAANLAALREIYSGELTTYSLGFKENSFCDLPRTQAIADHFGTHHITCELEGSEIAFLPQIIRQLGDPFVEGGLMVNYSLMKQIGASDAASDVLFCGDGNDSYFGTSGREVATRYLLSQSAGTGIAYFIYRLLNGSISERDNLLYRLRFHMEKVLYILEGDNFGFPTFTLKKMLQEEAFMPQVNLIKPDFRSFEHLYTQHAYQTDIEKMLNQVIAFKASQMALMCGNRLEFPFLDLDIYRFMTQLPVHLKYEGDSVKQISKGRSTAKYLLKRQYDSKLPATVKQKKCTGGFAPMALFFKEDNQRLRLKEYILSSSLFDSYLKREPVEAFLSQYDKEITKKSHWFWYRQNQSIRYFELLSLAVWWEQNVEGKEVSLR